MTLAISVKADMKATEKMLKNYQRVVIPQALPAAINKAMPQIRTLSVRQISREFGIPQKKIRQRFHLSRASRARKFGILNVGILPVRSGDIGKKPRQSKTGTRVGKYFFPKAFAATMPSGYRAAFKRKGKARLPIKVQVIDLSPRAETIIRRHTRIIMGRKFSIIFRHEVQFRLHRKGLA